jgi:ABC-type sugar transport system ATPase subunit
VADIRLTALEKIYEDGFRAVKSIDLEIREHEFMVLVGPSGCGKTTTLRMIAGLEDITSGEIHIGKTRVNDLEPKDRDIAMVFQNYALYPHMTVFDNMAYGLKLRGVKKSLIQQTVSATSHMLGLTDQLGKRPRDLSGGQRQRVALGRAIVRKPQAFLFDEPLSNLDAKLRGDMRFELKTLQQRLSTTTVYVTHDQIEAMTLGDRITVMSQGEIQQVGTPTEVYEHPRNRFVASFIGTPAMNFVLGTMQGHDGGQRFSAQGGFNLQMPGIHSLAAKSIPDQVTLGIRPEHLTVCNADAPGAIVGMHIVLVESLGDHQYVYLQHEGMKQTLIMKCSSTWKAKAGETISIAIAASKCHLFAGVDDFALNMSATPVP